MMPASAQAASLFVPVFANFLWQGTLGLLIALLVRFHLRNRGPAVRCRALLWVFAGIAASPAITAVIEISQRRAQRVASLSAYGLEGLTGGPRWWSPTAMVERFAEPSWLIYGYWAGLGIMSLRLITSMRAARRLQESCIPISEPAILSAIGARARELGLHATPALAACARVAVPCVIGVARPLLLIPMDYITALKPTMIPMVIGHELAHVQRYDQALNFCQRLVETLLYFHPAIWVISAMIEHERECSCDDAAVPPSEGREYARVLIEAITGAGRASASPELQAELSSRLTGTRRRTAMWHRIARLVDPSGSPAAHLRLPSGAAIACCCMTLLALTAAEVGAAPARVRTHSALSAIGMTPLHTAVRLGDATAVVALASPASVRVTDLHGRTPIHYAAHVGREGALKALLAAGADPLQADLAGRLPIDTLAGTHAFEEGEGAALAGIADLLGAADRGRQLSVAAMLGRAGVVEGLVTGQNVDGVALAPQLGRTALHWGACGGDVETCRRLVAAGADVRRVDHAGLTPGGLGITIRDSAELAGVLLDGAGVRDREEALGLAAEFGRAGVAQWLVGRGVGLARVNGHGESPLMLASRLDGLAGCDGGKPGVVAALLGAGADVRASDAAGCTCLHAAARKAGVAQAKVIRLLIAAGADVKARDHVGCRPVDVLDGGATAEVRRLLVSGAE